MADIVERITAYLSGGGLFNPELAHHDAVRDMIIDCRTEITALRAEIERLTKTSEAAKENRDSLLKAMIAKDAEVERLRAALPQLATDLITERDALHAEIERLRAVLMENAASLAAAISLLERGGKKAAPSDRMFAMMLNDYRISLEAARAALGGTDDRR